jgi:hypothetical protein
MLTDFFIAHRSEIDALDSNLEIVNFRPVLAGRIDPVKISTLDEILTGEKAQISAPVRESSSGESWIFLLREELGTALANMSLESSQRFAEQWARTEEWEADQGDVSELSQLLQSLKNLAVLAQGEGKEIYVYMCL